MKAKERHHLKQNEFADTVMRLVGSAGENRSRLVVIGAVVIVVAAVVGGYFYVRNRAEQQAGALLGAAMATSDAAIAPAPTIPGAEQQPGTYPTEDARREAALEAYAAVSAAYPGSRAALAARYHRATVLLEAGRAAEAGTAFEEVAALAGTSIYGVLARLGHAEALVAQQRYDEAIGILTDLAADRSGALPVDGVLMHLARASLRAGRTDEARAAFRRVVDEFPSSTYVAEARSELDAIG